MAKGRIAGGEGKLADVDADTQIKREHRREGR
jgi:hypothetical protein